jgi:predicted TPR repeat methyltransferase
MKWAELDIIIEDVYNSGYRSILDIGCGNGRIIDNLKFKIQNYLGIDSSS